MQALLVIDMQHAYLRGETPRFDREGVIARINDVAEHMRVGGGAVIFVRHGNEEAPAGSPGWQVDAGLQVGSNDIFIDKTACDAFAGTALLQRLEEMGVSTLFICGLATEFCVDSTVRAALSRGFDVIALADAHTTGDRPHMEAARIVAHHNWTWTHLAPPAGRQLRVLAAQDAIASMAG